MLDLRIELVASGTLVEGEDDHVAVTTIAAKVNDVNGLRELRPLLLAIGDREVNVGRSGRGLERRCQSNHETNGQQCSPHSASSLLCVRRTLNNPRSDTGEIQTGVSRYPSGG